MSIYSLAELNTNPNPYLYAEAARTSAKRQRLDALVADIDYTREACDVWDDLEAAHEAVYGCPQSDLERDYFTEWAESVIDNSLI